MNTPSSRKLVIFDLDGTLVDTLEPTFHCFAEAVYPVIGFRPTKEQVEERFGPADHEIVSEWVGPEHAEAAVKRLYDCYATQFAERGPFPGVHELLQGLKNAGHALALFTGRGRPSADQILRSMDLEKFFDATVTGEEVPQSKPAPDGLLKILKDLDIPAQDSVFIGDSPLDLGSAEAAGVEFVFFAPSEASSHRVPALRLTTHLADRLEELGFGLRSIS
ncbi:MAG: HAD family hydrolase [Candidatus Eisenbacteria bacterium]|uniref:HAD family hydrolase n=1 Tax=Eiseniibacteriota bacterium TaxID=2212470 RepID=A0A7Y2E644_UNCEI|nr:HAD family hydrolase [Candidatus Eisenbacteria bacterium]